MANPNWKCPDNWSEWRQWLAAGLHARNRWRLPVLLIGMLFANGRRTVTSWLRAAGVSDDFPCLALRHPKWGPLALPLQAMLYVRRKTMASIPPWRHWRFATKLQLAARWVEWIVPILKKAGKTVWIVVDGGYTKRPFESLDAYDGGAMGLGPLPRATMRPERLTLG